MPPTIVKPNSPPPPVIADYCDKAPQGGLNAKQFWTYIYNHQAKCRALFEGARRTTFAQAETPLNNAAKEYARLTDDKKGLIRDVTLGLHDMTGYQPSKSKGKGKDKQNNDDDKGKGQGKGQSKGKGKGKFIEDKTYSAGGFPAGISILYCDGELAERLCVNNVTTDSIGYALAPLNFLEKMIKTFANVYTDVLLIYPKPMALLDDAAGGHVMQWRARFRPEEKELPIKMGDRTVVMTCTMCQLGQDDIMVHNAILRCNRPVQSTMRINIQVHKDLHKGDFQKLQTNPATAKIFVTEVYGPVVTATADKTFKKTHADETVDVLQIVAVVKTENAKSFIDKSSTNGSFAFYADDMMNEELMHVKLDIKAGPEEVKKIKDKCGKIGAGAIRTRYGFAMRCYKGDETIIRAFCDPDIAVAVGEKLYTACRASLRAYVITDIPNNFTKLEITTFCKE